MQIKIAVATHKLYQMPKSDIYIPIESGAAFNQKDYGYQKDNIGDHISEKNRNFCELTALYWLWKNQEADYKGLTHYRRHFSKNKNKNLFSIGRFTDVLDRKKLENVLFEYDIIVPNKRKYYIETIGSHYENTHYKEDLIELEKVIAKLYPDYLQSYNYVLKRRSAHMFNMFIMKNNLFDQYCEWLFTILFALETQLDISEYSSFHSRVFGRVSEILLDVWIDKNKLSYCEIPSMFMEKQNWFKKVFKFLNAKIKHTKY